MYLLAPVRMQFKVQLPLILPPESISTSYQLMQSSTPSLYESRDDGSSILSLVRQAHEKNLDTFSWFSYWDLLSEHIEAGTKKWLWYGRVRKIQVQYDPDTLSLNTASLVVSLEPIGTFLRVTDHTPSNKSDITLHRCIGNGSYLGLIDVEDESQNGEIFSPDLGGITTIEADDKWLMTSSLLSSQYLTLREYYQKRQEFALTC